MSDPPGDTSINGHNGPVEAVLLLGTYEGEGKGLGDFSLKGHCHEGSPKAHFRGLSKDLTRTSVGQVGMEHSEYRAAEPRDSEQAAAEARPAAQAGTEPRPDTSDDMKLVADVLRKDRKATAEFVSRYTDWVYGYVRRRVMPRTEVAEDLTQEVFVAAWRGLQNYRGDASLRNWLLGIARHKVDDYYRK